MPAYPIVLQLPPPTTSLRAGGTRASYSFHSGRSLLPAYAALTEQQHPKHCCLPAWSGGSTAHTLPPPPRPATPAHPHLHSGPPPPLLYAFTRHLPIYTFPTHDFTHVPPHAWACLCCHRYCSRLDSSRGRHRAHCRVPRRRITRSAPPVPLPLQFTRLPATLCASYHPIPALQLPPTTTTHTHTHTPPHPTALPPLPHHTMPLPLHFPPTPLVLVEFPFHICSTDPWQLHWWTGFGGRNISRYAPAHVIAHCHDCIPFLPCSPGSAPSLPGSLHIHTHTSVLLKPSVHCHSTLNGFRSRGFTTILWMLYPTCPHTMHTLPSYGGLQNKFRLKVGHRFPRTTPSLQHWLDHRIVLNGGHVRTSFSLLPSAMPAPFPCRHTNRLAPPPSSAGPPHLPCLCPTSGLLPFNRQDYTHIFGWDITPHTATHTLTLHCMHPHTYLPHYLAPHTTTHTHLWFPFPPTHTHTPHTLLPAPFAFVAGTPSLGSPHYTFTTTHVCSHMDQLHSNSGVVLRTTLLPPYRATLVPVVTKPRCHTITLLNKHSCAFSCRSGCVIL